MTEPAAHGGWRASLDLHLQCLDGRTRITHRRHSGPLMVQRAFYPERNSAGPDSLRESSPVRATTGEPCHVYLIHPPGGVAGGDELDLAVQACPGAHVLLTTPAAGKFYRRGTAGPASLTQNLRADDAVLEWFPQENIFYPDAVAHVSTTVHLSGTARFIGWELSCFGLPASGLTLQSGVVTQRFALWRDRRPLLIEALNIDQTCLSASWGLAGCNALGTWLAAPAGTMELATARATMANGCAGIIVACTLVDDVLVCRGRAMRADQLKQAFVELWGALRPALVGRQPAAPRIWAT